jgi:signal transduction histidine kinase
MAAYRELALFYLDINSDSAMYFIEKDLPLAKKLNLKLWEADAHDLMGLITRNTGNYVQSLKSFNAALAIAENTDSEKNIWNISKFTIGQLPQFARLSMLATIQSDASGLYEITENYDKQLKVIQSCLKNGFSINDKTLLSQGFRGLGQLYFRQNQLDSALASYKRSINYSNEVRYNKYSGSSFLRIGDIYLKQGLPKLALENYLTALKFDIEQNNYAGLGLDQVAIAIYYNTIGNNDSALYYAKSGLAITKNTGNVTGTIIGYNTLVTIYKSQKKSDSALLFLQLATDAKDSLLSLAKIKQLQNIGFDEELRLQELEKNRIETQSKIRTYGMLTGLLVLSIIGFILYRNNRQKQKANIVLQEQKDKVEITLAELKATQTQLIQSEKMASLGELTAGIAHEIQNPLNFVNNFSEVSTELVDEMNEEIKKGNLEDATAIAADLKQNLEKINHHGKRAGDIVKGMLQHSRTSSGQKEPTDINALTDEYLRLAYHGLRAKDKDFNATMKTDFDESIGKINIIPQDIGRVILNLITNAFYVVNEKIKQEIAGYEPTVSVSTKKDGDKVFVSVKDNGKGIPPKILDKIFQPFFTTKPTGQGTGLGLSLSYDIVKAHGGELKVETKEGEGTTFIIQLQA